MKLTHPLCYTIKIITILDHKKLKIKTPNSTLCTFSIPTEIKKIKIDFEFILVNIKNNGHPLFLILSVKLEKEGLKQKIEKGNTICINICDNLQNYNFGRS